MALVSGFTTINGGTLITIPAGMYWRGSVSISASLTAAVGVGSAQSLPVVAVDDPGGSSVDGLVVAGVSLTTPAINLLSLLGVTSNQSLCQPNIVIQAPPANAITLKLNKDNATQVIAVASGATSTS